MAGLTMIGRVPVLGLVLELQQRGFPPSMCARTQAMSISSHAVFRQARSEKPFPGVRLRATRHETLSWKFCTAAADPRFAPQRSTFNERNLHRTTSDLDARGA
jgi:hypothetical protein